jgi:hypothetical protein
MKALTPLFLHGPSRAPIGEGMRLPTRWMISCLLGLVLTPLVHGQYFGPNKVRHESLDFKV